MVQLRYRGHVSVGTISKQRGKCMCQNDRSKTSLTSFTIIILSLCLFVMVIGLGCSARKPPKNSPSVNLPSTKDTSNASQTSKNAADYSSDSAAQGRNKCGTLPPICQGLSEKTLIRQDADIATLNSAIAKYRGKGCRFTQPPRCYTGEKQKCPHECVP